MKIKLKKTPEQLELLQALIDKDPIKRIKAREEFARAISEPILTVIQQGATLSAVFVDFPFDKYSGLRMIPLDRYYDVKHVDYVRVWSQSRPGGLPTQFTHPNSEMPFTTYRLDSAIAFEEKWIRFNQIDIVSADLTRLAQELLLKREKNAAGILLGALAGASTTVRVGSNDTTFRHVMRSQSANQFQIHDYNRLFTRIKRIRSSWAGGTPNTEQSRGLTDLFISPEIEEYLRSMAYNPINTRAGVTDTTGTSAGSTVGIPATDAQREAWFNSAGAPTFFNVALHTLNELGVGYKWNTLFDTAAGSTDFGAYGDGTSATTFDGAAEEILIGVDRSMETLLRPVAVDSDIGSEFSLKPDDQFVARAEKIGYYGSMEEGYIVVDDRALCGMIV